MSQVIDPMEAEPLEAILVDSGPARTATAAAWIVLGLVALLVVWFVWTQVLSPSSGTSVGSYVDGDSGHLYESLKDQFRAEFPTVPRRRQESGEFGPTVVVDSRPGPDYLFAVIREPEPETGLESYTSTLNNAARALVQQSKGTLVSQSPPLPLAISSVAVKDVVFRNGDDYYRNRLILATDRLYTLQVMVKGSDDAAFTALAKTFKVLGPR